MKCKHLNNDICKFASELSGEVAKTSPQACSKCKEYAGFNNQVTNSLAVTSLVLLKKLDIEKHQHLLVATHDPAFIKDGPGTELKKSISWFYSPKKKKCKCLTRIQKMNHWGPDECEKRIETIMRWLKHSAAIAKIPYFPFAVKLVVKRAIKRSRLQLRRLQDENAR